MNVAIVGLGLIGGSFAKTFKKRTSYKVLGYDIDQSVEKEALQSNAIDERLDLNRLSDCDLILVALYPNDTIGFVTKYAERIKKDSIVADTCGVKRSVCAKLNEVADKNGFVFIGGHPMAGIERFGFSNATDNLFSGASMILTPPEHLPEERIKVLETLFLELGFGGVCVTTPEIHDKTIAYTSQLAHVLSSSYVKIKEATTHRGFSAGSFQDMTRVARLNETMWTELFMENSDFLSEKIDELTGYLSDYSKAIRQGDREETKSLLREGSLRKERIESEGSSCKK